MSAASTGSAIAREGGWNAAPTVRARRRREVLLLGAFLVVLWGVTGMVSPRFLSVDNIRDILVQAAPLGFVVIGQMLVIVARGLDLSVASVMATAAVISTGLLQSVAGIFAVARPTCAGCTPTAPASVT